MKVLALFALMAFVAVARSQVENPALQCYSCLGDECNDLSSDKLITCYEEDDTPAVTTPAPTDTTESNTDSTPTTTETGSTITTLPPTGSTTPSATPTTTEASVTTTEASVTTTEASVTTTDAPVTTTVATVTTTEATVTTTVATVTTTDATVTTTEAPVTTTVATVTTTEAPVTTTEAPVATTEAPVATTEAPVPTTEAPVPTTEAPVPTTEAPTTTAPDTQNAIVSGAAVRQVVVRQPSPAALLIRNYRSISRTGRTLPMSFCYTINVKDGDITQEKRGCALIPSGEAACPVIEAGLSSSSNCFVCQTDGCNNGAVAFQLSLAAILAGIFVKFLM